MPSFVVLGVSGCGKSTIAAALAERTGGLFVDADTYHPASNVEKMHHGIPLTDADRAEWLDCLHGVLEKHQADTRPVFLACSALKQAYRDHLAAGLPSVGFIYLKGSREVIARRLHARKGHFMPETLLDSQFATLEEPRGVLTVDVDQTVDAIVDEILASLALPEVSPHPTSP